MNIPITEPRFTPEDLLTMPEAKDRGYELEDGRLVEKPMSMLASWVGGRCGRLLGTYCDDRKLGWVLDSDNTYQCFPEQPNRVRRPDVSFIRAGRVSYDQFVKGHVRVAPDLMVEAISPSDEYHDIMHRVRLFRDAGTRLIWIIDPEERIVSVYRADGSTSCLNEDQELSGEDVVPGFRCKVRDLFPPPELLATLTGNPQDQEEV